MRRSFADSILAVVYPQECSICKMLVESAGDGAACSGCWNATKIFQADETLCRKCGAFSFYGRGSEPDRCGKCDDHHYDRAYAAGLYEKALAASIVRLKRTPHIPSRVRGLLFETLSRISIDASTTVIPVPLSKPRLHERGFNQAAVIGKAVSKHAGLTLDDATLVRKVHTPMHRAGMDSKARAMTVKSAFEVMRPKLVEGRKILLVDDVMTSGATVSACAAVLKKSGAATVNVLTIARAA